jgi:hypothetical protein
MMDDVDEKARFAAAGQQIDLKFELDGHTGH